MATGIVPQPFRVLSRIRPEHTPSHGPRDSWHSERTIRTRRLYQKTTEPSRFGPARTVPSSSGGGAMTTALQGAELDVLSDDSEFVLSHLNHPTDGQPTLLGRTAATPPPAATVTELEHAQGLRAELEASV